MARASHAAAARVVTPLGPCQPAVAEAFAGAQCDLMTDRVEVHGRASQVQLYRVLLVPVGRWTNTLSRWAVPVR